VVAADGIHNVPNVAHVPPDGYIMESRPVILPSISIQVGPKGGTKRVSTLADTGASASIVDRDFLVRTFGRDILGRLFKNGYRPHFRIADGSLAVPLGQIKLTFTIEGIRFKNVFYVMHKCAHNIIFGGDFFDAHDALIDYRARKVALHHDGQVVRCDFRAPADRWHAFFRVPPRFTAPPRALSSLAIPWW
jgi:hypothetical protein